VTKAQLEGLAALWTPELDVAENDNEGFNLEGWLTEHGLRWSHKKPWNGGTMYHFQDCPFEPEHSKSFWVARHASGAPVAGCFGNRCQGKGWRDLRDKLEPGWRAKRLMVIKNGVLHAIRKQKIEDEVFYVPEPVATFSMDVHNAVTFEEGEYLYTTITARMRQTEWTFKPGALNSAREFQAALPSVEYTWLGESGDIQKLRQWIASKPYPRQEGTHVAGVHGQAFLCEHGTIGQTDLIYESDVAPSCWFQRLSPQARRSFRHWQTRCSPSIRLTWSCVS
jgi:hypothetical protein